MMLATFRHIDRRYLPKTGRQRARASESRAMHARLSLSTLLRINLCRVAEYESRYNNRQER